MYQRRVIPPDSARFLPPRCRGGNHRVVMVATGVGSPRDRGETLETKLSRLFQIGGLALALLLAAFAAGGVVPGEAEAAVQTVEDEADDGGFDDWGLLGLLGLAGLLRRPARAVVVADRPTTGGTRLS